MSTYITEPFSTHRIITLLFANAMSFTVGLALNNALTRTFALIPIGQGDGTAQAWIYVLLIVPISLAVFYLLSRRRKQNAT